MILGFKPQFKEPILKATKKHTIREDASDRWFGDRKIHMATGVRTKNYECFAEKLCTGVQLIDIDPYTQTIRIDGRELKDCAEMRDLAVNDGFEGVSEFFDYFKKPFIGKIIHWTGLRY